jgi:hypothetical protein
MRGHRSPPRTGGRPIPGIPDQDKLPLPDYEQLTAQAIGQRIRPLSREEVRQLLDYEWAHACRPAVTEAMATRLAELDAAEATPRGMT